MEETDYGIVEMKQPEFPVRSLLRVPHKNGALTVSYPSFGSNTYNNNLTEMKKPYSHPITGERISFREPSTSESISAASYNFSELAKLQIFDPRWLQVGIIVRTSEGVYVNPPKDEKGNPIIDKEILKSFLDQSNKVNGIWLYPGSDPNAKDFGFAPYESFTRGVQDCDTFAEGGLARVLEHTQEKVAKNLREIASLKNYRRGVNVRGFDEVKEPALRVAGLDSDWDLDHDGLGLYGNFWVDGNSGYVFGVLE